MIHECDECHKKFKCSEYCSHKKFDYLCLCDECDKKRGGGEMEVRCKIKFLVEKEKVLFT